MKDKGVCKGCKYYITTGSASGTKATCDYIGKTGHSRLLTEEKNGGYKTDSCICYEAKPRGRKRKSADSVENGSSAEGATEAAG